jgi:hypothetical protein
MGWKRQDKELTPQEAIALAQRELAPYWIGSAPMVAGVRLENKFFLYALEKEFEKKPWFILFIDITDFSGEFAASIIQEWHRRYSSHPIGFLVVVVPAYEFLKNDKTLVKEWLEDLRINCPIVIDPDGGLVGAFGTRDLPRFIIFKNGRFFGDYSGNNWYVNPEHQIQTFLRETDPGLPLLPTQKQVTNDGHDLLRLEFGFHPRLGKVHSIFQKGFTVPEGSERRVFHWIGGVRPRKMEAGELFVSGHWEQEPERIITSDMGALIAFKCPGRKISLIASAMPDGKEPPRIVLEVNGDTISESYLRKDAFLDDQGRAMITVKQVRIYNVICDLPEDKREITLRFPNADVAPIALYGIRAGN